MYQMNPRWQTAAILQKVDKSPYLGNSSTDRHKIWYGDAEWPSLLNQPLKI